MAAPVPPGARRSFDEIVEGLEVELSHPLTREDVEAFAALSGDRNPLHLDGEYARRLGYRGPVVHGMLSASFVSALIGSQIPGPGALWVSQAFDFLKPVFAGDTLIVRAVVRQKSASTRLLVLAISVRNQSGDEVLSGSATVRVPPAEEPEAESQPPAEVVLVTGGSRGIGAAVAVRVSAPGVVVAVNSLRPGPAASAVLSAVAERGGRPILVPGDVSKQDEVDRIISVIEAEAGPVGAIVHAAAPPNPPRPFDSTEWKQFEEQFAVQVGGARHLARRTLPGMASRGAGSLVFVGSIYGDSMPPPHQAAYAAAKGALAALARALAGEYGPRGVRVNVVAPGMTMTDRVSDLPEKARLVAKMQTPLRRLARPEDVAEVVAFLLSPAARHVTGETVRVGGGSSGP